MGVAGGRAKRSRVAPVARTARHTWKSALEMLLSWKLRADLLATRAKGGLELGGVARDPPFAPGRVPILLGSRVPPEKRGGPPRRHPVEHSIR